MKFFHYIPPSKKGGVTIAHELIEHNQGKTLIIAVAQASDKDNYCRRTGRDVALDNYINGKVFSFVVKGSKKNIQKRIETQLWTFSHSIYKMQSNHAN